MIENETKSEKRAARRGEKAKEGESEISQSYKLGYDAGERMDT
jgi:hypothetical protein